MTPRERLLKLSERLAERRHHCRILREEIEQVGPLISALGSGLGCCIQDVEEQPEARVKETLAEARR